MGEHINVQDGGFALEIATNLYGYGYFNQNQIEINNGTFETLADNGGAIRLAIYDGDFYMIGDVLLNDYNGEIYQIKSMICPCCESQPIGKMHLVKNINEQR